MFREPDSRVPFITPSLVRSACTSLQSVVCPSNTSTPIAGRKKPPTPELLSRPDKRTGVHPNNHPWNGTVHVYVDVASDGLDAYNDDTTTGRIRTMTTRTPTPNGRTCASWPPTSRRSGGSGCRWCRGPTPGVRRGDPYWTHSPRPSQPRRRVPTGGASVTELILCGWKSRRKLGPPREVVGR